MTGAAKGGRSARERDTRSPGFAAEAHRQSLAVAQVAQERDDQAFIDAISEDSGA